MASSSHIFRSLPDTSLFDGLFTFIKKNKAIPEFLAGLKPDDPKVLSLLSAITEGNPQADIFSDPQCYLYLLYLLQTKQVGLNGMTVYAYLMALMQFTDKQALREGDEDMKFPRGLQVEFLFRDKQITEEGKVFLDEMVSRLAKINCEIDVQELNAFVVNMPLSETWLLKVDLKAYTEEKDCDVIVKQLANNMPTMRFVREDDVYTIWVPSFTLVNYILSRLSPDPLAMQFIFGQVNPKTLKSMHQQGTHPVPLYAPAVLSNMPKVHTYRAGPFFNMLHDIGHTFWGSMLSKDERGWMLEYFVSQLAEMQKEAREHKDEALAAHLDILLERAWDFDLTQLSMFANSQDRFSQYIGKILGYSLYACNFYPYTKVEFEPIGACVYDRLYFLFQKYFSNGQGKSQQEQEINQCVLNRIWQAGGEFYRERNVVPALRQLNGIASSYSTRDYVNEDTIKWSEWLALLESTSDSKALWDKACGQHHFEYFICKHDLKFFHPYIPMTAEKLERWKQIVRDKIELAAKPKFDYHSMPYMSKYRFDLIRSSALIEAKSESNIEVVSDENEVSKKAKYSCKIG